MFSSDVRLCKIFSSSNGLIYVASWIEFVSTHALLAKCIISSVGSAFTFIILIMNLYAFGEKKISATFG